MNMITISANVINWVIQGLIFICLLALIYIFTSVENEDGTVLISSTKIRANTSKDVSMSVHSEEENILHSPDFQHLLNGPIYLAADDPQLIRYVRNHILIPPLSLPYNLSKPEVQDPSAGQTKRALEILNKMGRSFDTLWRQVA
ncbi:unnamed protein product [Meganyctiphanes norvegica]|uniref:Uncharacterized protein n=1 Tax=Meganyctiphanes norvegica TaxID=48144 RepID=A0AAV2SRM4_MEGNR